MNKQIEEMERVLNELNEKFFEYCGPMSCDDCEYNKHENCSLRYKAEALYNAGYRKTTDVAEEIFVEIAKLVQVYLNDADYSFGEFALDIADLQKKYESEGRR